MDRGRERNRGVCGGSRIVYDCSAAVLSVRGAKSVCDRCMDAPGFTPGTDRQRDPKHPGVPGEKNCCGTRGDLCGTEFPALLLQREPARARYTIWPTYRDHEVGQRDASIDQDSSIRTARVSSGSPG